MEEKNKEIIEKIMQKKQFSQLPKSVVERILNLKKIKNLDDETKVKEVRAILNRIFGAFLTNKILKGKINSLEILKKHISSKDRNYSELYDRLFAGNEKTIIDLGAGINGFSYSFLSKHSRIKYVAIEGIGQLVDLMNDYFKQGNFNAIAIHEDLFNLSKILEIVQKQKKPKIVFMFNMIDGLEVIERDYSKKLILALIDNAKVDKIVLSFTTHSLIKKKKFKARRYWILNFIFNNFNVIDDFYSAEERFIVFSKK